MSTFWPLLRFQLASGVRVTLRLLMPLVVVYSVLVGFFGPDLTNNLARVLFPQPATGVAIAILVAILYGTAQQAARLLIPGPRSWLRHLPTSARQQRMTAVASITIAQLPLSGGLLGLAVLAASLQGRAAGFGVSAVLMTSLATAIAAETRSERSLRNRLCLILALAAAVCFAQNQPAAWVFGFALLGAAIAEFWTRPASRSVRERTRRMIRRPLQDGASVNAFHARLLWRSCGPHLASGWPVALLPVGAGLFFVLNNDLPPTYELLGLRLGAGLGISLILLANVSVLIERRTPWPWLRSLPDSSHHRIRRDALLLLLLASVAPLATAVAAGRPVVLATSLPLLGALAVRAAGTVASAGADRTRGPGAFAGEALGAAALVSLVPWTSLVLLLVTPWLLQRAALRDRRAPVLAFQELRASRDPMTGVDA
ncbi:MAG: hypothetical protein AAGK22_00920 [Acidobacteriota bacterium]